MIDSCGWPIAREGVSVQIGLGAQRFRHTDQKTDNTHNISMSHGFENAARRGERLYMKITQIWQKSPLAQWVQQC